MLRSVRGLPASGGRTAGRFMVIVDSLHKGLGV
jgi:hypothetical protein